MSSRMIAAAAAALMMIAAPAFAQTAAPAAKPAATTTAPAAAPAAKPAKAEPATTAITKKVNINTATATELDALPQIGDKRSEAIIKNRPYKATNELVSKKVLSQGVYDKIKGSIVAR